jgi:uroporphyrinogen decarboxylase
MPEAELRAFVCGIIAACLSGGRFALGSGNSVANYALLPNYFAMVEEGLTWQG